MGHPNASSNNSAKHQTKINNSALDFDASIFLCLSAHSNFERPFRKATFAKDLRLLRLALRKDFLIKFQAHLFKSIKSFFRFMAFLHFLAFCLLVLHFF